MEVSDTLTVVALGTGTLIVRSAGVGYRLLTALSLSLYSFGQETCCGSETCERRDSASLKNVAKRGDRGVGDRDPRRASMGRFPWSDVFPRVERFAEQHVFRPEFLKVAK
jgi:hypothetical protein